MATLTKARPSHGPRYRSHKSTVQPSEHSAENSWFVLLMAVVLVLGFVFIGAISYVLLLG